MCDATCYAAIPSAPLAAWARHLETGQYGSIVAQRDGSIIVHGVDPVIMAIDGIIAGTDPSDVQHWCPVDVEAWYDGNGSIIEAAEVSA